MVKSFLKSLNFNTWAPSQHDTLQFLRGKTRVTPPLTLIPVLSHSAKHKAEVRAWGSGCPGGFRFWQLSSSSHHISSRLLRIASSNSMSALRNRTLKLRAELFNQHVLYANLSQCFLFLFFFETKCHNVVQAGLEHSDSPASASLVLDYKGVPSRLLFSRRKGISKFLHSKIHTFLNTSFWTGWSSTW